VQRRGAAKGDQGTLADRHPALDRVHAGGVGHVLVDDLGNTERGFRGGQPLGDARQGRAGARRIERDPSSREALRVDLADDQIGVGHRRRATAAAIAGRAGLRSGAVGADGDAFEDVAPGDRAAAGADLHHLDHGNAQRRAAALLETRAAIDLERARLERQAVVDQADLGRGPAHVKGQDARLPALLGNAPRK